MNVCCLKLKKKKKKKKKHVTVCLLHDHPNLICHTVRFYFFHKPNFLHWVESTATLVRISSVSPLPAPLLLVLDCPCLHQFLYEVCLILLVQKISFQVQPAGVLPYSQHTVFFFKDYLFKCLLYFYCNRPYFASVAHDAGIGRFSSVYLNLNQAFLTNTVCFNSKRAFKLSFNTLLKCVRSFFFLPPLRSKLVMRPGKITCTA